MNFGHFLDLRFFADTVAELSQRLMPSFGPCGLDRLVTSTGGAVATVSSGEDILRSLPVNHAIDKMIIDSALAHCSKTGSGSKSFVILLSSIMSRLVECQRTHGGAEVCFRVLAARSLARFKNLIRTLVAPEILERCTRCNSIDHELIKSMLRSFINCRRSTHSDLLSDVLYKALFYNQGLVDYNTLKLRLSNLSSVFGSVCIESHDEPPEKSRIESALILPRNYLMHHSQQNHEEDAGQGVGFVLLKLEEQQSNDCITVKGMLQATSLLQFKSKQWRKMCDQLSLLGVKLLLSNTKVSDELKCWCSLRKISVVQCLPEEDMERLMKHFAIHPLTSTHNIESGDELKYIGLLRSFGTTVVNGQDYACLKPPQIFQKKLEAQRCFDVFPFQIMICGFSSNICNQYKEKMKRALKQLNSWLIPFTYQPETLTINKTTACHSLTTIQVRGDDTNVRDNNLETLLQGILTSSSSDHKLISHDQSVLFCGLHIPANGAFEITVSTAIKKFLSLPKLIQNSFLSTDGGTSVERELSDTDLEVWKTIMDALLEIPLLLIKNSYASNHSKLRTKAHLMNELDQLMKGDDLLLKEGKNNGHLTNKFVIINCRRGKLEMTSGEEGPVEALRSKIELLHDVLSLCEQLLRLEAVVPIRVKTTREEK